MEEDDVLAFVQDTIRSVWTLELLVLMQQGADRAWPTAELVAALRANTRVVTEGLSALESVGLVRLDEAGMVRYRPASSALAETIRDVVDLYNRKPLAVVRTILTSPTDKIQTFADAFRFRK
ncbi:MAG TPA: hypothetical protein VGG99_14280 [Acetobacteraceae bacterium]